jgi:pimeloyl-ACP methyl ester carboxylesterase
VERVAVRGGQLEAWTSGDGDPVLLIHGAVLADSFRCIEGQRALAGYRLISYHRRGFAGSTKHRGAFGIPDHARDAEAVLAHFGIARAHIVGHSYGARAAMALALASPEVVRALVLLEPGLATVGAAADAPARYQPLADLYRGGDAIGAARAVLAGLGGHDAEHLLAKTMPRGWFEQAVNDVGTFFDVEIPSMPQWAFDTPEAARLTQPVLDIVGDASLPLFLDGSRWLRRHLPDVQGVTLRGVNHLLQMADPLSVASAVGAFLDEQRSTG